MKINSFTWQDETKLAGTYGDLLPPQKNKEFIALVWHEQMESWTSSSFSQFVRSVMWPPETNIQSCLLVMNDASSNLASKFRQALTNCCRSGFNVAFTCSKWGFLSIERPEAYSDCWHCQLSLNHSHTTMEFISRKTLANQDKQHMKKQTHIQQKCKWKLIKILWKKSSRNSKEDAPTSNLLLKW